MNLNLKKTYIILSIVFFYNFKPMAQSIEENIVANPGFELYAGTPIGWFYKGDHFTDIMKYWYSPTSASPDIFGPKVHVPAKWAEKGFGNQTARSGSSMVGITVYGCNDGKPHCREYVQIQLSEPLVKGQKYYVEFWVSHLEKSLAINQLAIYFSEEAIRQQTDELLAYTPQVISSSVVFAADNSWKKISAEFVADKEASYLTIGNFNTDEQTIVKAIHPEPLKYAYYYLDDVLLQKKPPIINVPIQKDDLSVMPLVKGQLVTLKNIFFDFNKSELLPRSFIELNKLLVILKEHPGMKIEIHGHTDSYGDDDYNLELSLKRSKAVVDYLLQNGISTDQVGYVGFGETRPIADNNDEDGRQLNRRVDFLVVEKDKFTN